MKKTLFSILLMAFAATAVVGQDAATQQQLDKLSGQIQDLQAALAQQGKRLDALEKEISGLSDKVNSPQVNHSASEDGLKKLAEQVQEIDKKRQDDRDLILKQIEKLGKLIGSAPAGHKVVPNTEVPTAGVDNSASGGPQKGYYYPVQAGDTIAAIAKAYRDKGVKITTEQILKANPGLDPKSLIPGKTKVFIPDPNAK
jgi:phage tail protein X/cell division protein FtsL